MTDDLMHDELLAPPGSSVPEEGAPAEGGWQFSHGFPDSRQAVRIWVDPETRQLQRVKLSNRWRERLAGRSLGDAFFEAFFLANTRFGSSRNMEYPEIEAEEPEGDFTLDQLLDRLDELTERSAELDARAPENVRWADFEGERVRVSGRGGWVTVTLSLAGLTERVEFDRDWLAKADQSTICDQVLTVHRKAYERYVPPVFVPGEREELAAEFQQVQLALQSLMSKGIA